jgi:DNA recombination protein Rad52
LKAKLDPKHVKSRQASGATLHYVEGWQAIAEANRIFGFDGWDRETLSTNCVSNSKNRGDYLVAYTAKVRITVRAGKTIVVREGSGSGEAKSFSAGQAHELALKSAETDATKRALASFGNPFGLALYDPEQNGVRKPSNGKFASSLALEVGPWILRTREGAMFSVLDTPQAFAETLSNALKDAATIEDLYGVWEQNVATVRALHRLYRQLGAAQGSDGIRLVAFLKARARELASKGEPASAKAASSEKPNDTPSPPPPTRIDKSVLTISEPKRILATTTGFIGNWKRNPRCLTSRTHSPCMDALVSLT